jgi:iron complex transport system substrate-binding protein
MNPPKPLAKLTYAAFAAVGVTGLAACSASPTSPASAAGSGTTASTPAASGSMSATFLRGSSGLPGSAAFPVTVTAANGKVTITARPSRIVSLAPTMTEDLYAVGAGSQVVAVDADSNYPAGVPATKLSGLTPNLEAIAKYNPSLVVASQDSGGLVKGLARLGIPVLVEPATATIPAAYAQIEQIGQATGHAAQAARVVSGMRQQIAAAVAAVGSSHKGLTYYWELSASPYYSATSTTFIGQVIALFGLKNIADKASKPATDGGYPQLSAEYIVTAKPDIIFLGDNSPADGNQPPSVVARRPGWAGIPAVKDNEIIALNDDIASRWGPRLPQLVAEIAQAIERAPAP